MSDTRMDDTDILDYTQDVRQRIVESLFVEGVVTKDPKEMAILEKTLGSMDKQVFSKARQKSLDREIDNNEQARQYIMELFETMDQRGGTAESPMGTAPIPEPEIGDAEIDAGSLEVGISDEGFEDFTKRMDRE